MRTFHCKAATPLDFDAVIHAITGVYPGTRIIQQDWYADRYRKEVEVAKRFGLPIPNEPIISLQRVWAERGLQRGFEVPIRDGLTLYARLDKTGGYFLSRSVDFADTDVARLHKILESFGLAIRHCQ